MGSEPDLEMKTFLILLNGLITLTSMDGFSAEIPNQDAMRAQEMIRILKEEGAAGKIARLEVLYLPARILTRTQTSPQMLEKNYHYRLVITNTSVAQTLDSFVNALEKTKMTQRKDRADFRWACLIYDKNDVRILSIFLDGECTKAAIGDLSVILDGPLNNWFKANFLNCFE